MKYLYFILFCILFTGCYNVERNCKNFKTGKFQFEQEIDGKKHITLFERNDAVQIETYQGKTDTASVRWLNDCEFILQKIHPRNMQEKKAYHMKILTTNENSYTFEYSFVGDSRKQKGTVTKLN